MFSFLAKFWNNFSASLINLLARLVDLLPDSPFVIIDNSAISSYLPTLNYFVPITEIIAILEIWLVAITTYYLFSVALRWIKVIES